MRLSKFEQQTIKQSIYALDANAKVVLFGSRINDAARGGDIDLLIISNNLKRQQLGKIRWQLWEKLGEQKIDLVLSDTQLSNTFARVVFKNGIIL
jgi:predicted nucleotidyltransferase